VPARNDAAVCGLARSLVRRRNANATNSIKAQIERIKGICMLCASAGGRRERFSPTSRRHHTNSGHYSLIRRNVKPSACVYVQRAPLSRLGGETKKKRGIATYYARGLVYQRPREIIKKAAAPSAIKHRRRKMSPSFICRLHSHSHRTLRRFLSVTTVTPR
jgi:hypothetical protein